MAASVYLSNTAILGGQPALTVESGFLALTDEASMARVEREVAGWLRELGMRPDGPPPGGCAWWIERNEVVTSGATGIFYPDVERGHFVLKSARRGHVTDFYGRLL